MMVRAFHWQYGDILLAIYFFVFTYYFVLSLKNKYTILYYTYAKLIIKRQSSFTQTPSKSADDSYLNKKNSFQAM